MAEFAPVGSSTKVTLTGGAAQTVALPTIPTGGAIRLMTTAMGTRILLYAILGNGSTVVTVNDGMPLDLPANSSLVIGVSAGETHIALIGGGGSSVTLFITAGALI